MQKIYTTQLILSSICLIDVSSNVYIQTINILQLKKINVSTNVFPNILKDIINYQIIQMNNQTTIEAQNYAINDNFQPIIIYYFGKFLKKQMKSTKNQPSFQIDDNTQSVVHYKSVSVSSSFFKLVKAINNCQSKDLYQITLKTLQPLLVLQISRYCKLKQGLIQQQILLKGMQKYIQYYLQNMQHYEGIKQDDKELSKQFQNMINKSIDFSQFYLSVKKEINKLYEQKYQNQNMTSRIILLQIIESLIQIIGYRQQEALDEIISHQPSINQHRNLVDNQPNFSQYSRITNQDLHKAHLKKDIVRKVEELSGICEQIPQLEIFRRNEIEHCSESGNNFIKIIDVVIGLHWKIHQLLGNQPMKIIAELALIQKQLKDISEQTTRMLQSSNHSDGRQPTLMFKNNYKANRISPILHKIRNNFLELVSLYKNSKQPNHFRNKPETSELIRWQKIKQIIETFHQTLQKNTYDDWINLIEKEEHNKYDGKIIKILDLCLLVVKNKSSNNQNHEEVQTHRKLEKQVDTLITDFQKIEEENQYLHREIDSLLANAEDYEQSILERDNIIQHLTNIREKLTNDNTVLIKEYEMLVHENDHNNLNFEHLNNKSQVENKMARERLKIMNQKLNTDMLLLEQEKSSMKLHIAQLQGSIDRMQKQNKMQTNILENKINDKDMELNNAKKELQGLKQITKNQINDIQHQLDQYKINNRTLSTQKQNLQLQLVDTSNSISDLRNKLHNNDQNNLIDHSYSQQYQLANEQLKKQIIQLFNDREKLIIQGKNLEAKLQNSIIDCNNQQKHQSELREELRNIRNQFQKVNESNEMNKNYRSKYESILQQFNEQDKGMTKVIIQNNKLKSHIAQVEQKQVIIPREQNHQGQHLIQTQYRELENHCKELSAQNSSIIRKNAQLQRIESDLKGLLQDEKNHGRKREQQNRVKEEQIQSEVNKQRDEDKLLIAKLRDEIMKQMHHISQYENKNMAENQSRNRNESKLKEITQGSKSLSQQNQVLKNQINKEIQKYRTEVRKVEQCKIQIQSLLNQRQFLKQQLRKIQMDVRQPKQKCEALEKELQRFMDQNNRIQEEQKQSKKVHLQSQQLKGQINNIRRENNQLQQSKKEGFHLKKQIVKLQQQIAKRQYEHKFELANLQRAILQNEKNRNDMNNHINNLIHEKSVMQSQTIQKQKQLSGFYNQITILKTREEELIRRLQCNDHQIQSRTHDKEMLNEMKKSVEKLHEQIRSLKKELTDKDTIIRELKANHHQMVEEYEELRDNFQQDINETNTKKELANASKAIFELNKQRSQQQITHKNESKFLQEKIKNLESLVLALKNEIELLNDKLSFRKETTTQEIRYKRGEKQLLDKEKIIRMNQFGLSQENVMKLDKVKSTQLQIEFLKEKIKNLQILVKSISQQNCILGDKLSMTQDKKSSSGSILSAQNQTDQIQMVEVMHSQLESKDKIINDLKSQVAKLKQELINERNKCIEIEQKLQYLNEFKQLKLNFEEWVRIKKTIKMSEERIEHYKLIEKQLQSELKQFMLRQHSYIQQISSLTGKLQLKEKSVEKVSCQVLDFTKKSSKPPKLSRD